MKKLLIVCFLLGISASAGEVQALSTGEQETLIQLCEKEYGIKVNQMSESDLQNIERNLKTVRSEDISM